MRPEDFASLPDRLTFTVDVEEPGGASEGPVRYPATTMRLLDFLAARGAVGTFFVVGDIARRTPGLVREIAGRGHEIASHGDRHLPLPGQEPSRFRRESGDGRRLLEDLTGTAVLGFRAPLFSLTRASAWAPDMLAAAGFAYSSSVLPVRGGMFAWPGAPMRPFLWPCGLLELPCPVGRVGPFRLPFLGGMYLRYLPPWRLRQAARSCSTDAVWTYCHPYDLDTGERLRRLPGIGRVSSFFLWWNRAATLDRLAAIIHGRTVVPFRERIRELAVGAPVFEPGRAAAASAQPRPSRHHAVAAAASSRRRPRAGGSSGVSVTPVTRKAP